MTIRPRRHRDWTLETAKAIPRFPSLQVDIGGTRYMFVEDISLGLLPFDVRSGRSTFKADLSGASNEKDRALLLLSSLGGRDDSDLAEILIHSLQEIAQNLSWFGRVPYEIVHPQDDHSVFLLRTFTPQRLFNVYWGWVQIVPKKDRQICKKTVNWLPRHDIWVIGMPKLLGGYRGYRAILRNFRRFNNYGPRFWRDDLTRGVTPTRSFNFQEYRDQIELF